MRDVVAYLVDQDFDTAEGAPTDGLAGDDAKPSFDLIKPRRPDRSEMKVDNGFFSNQAHTSGVVCVDKLSNTT